MHRSLVAVLLAGPSAAVAAPADFDPSFGGVMVETNSGSTASALAIGDDGKIVAVGKPRRRARAFASTSA